MTTRMTPRFWEADMNRSRSVRTARGLPLWGLAARAGVSATTLSAIERWGYRPGTDVRRRIAASLGVAVTEIWPVHANGERARRGAER